MLTLPGLLLAVVVLFMFGASIKNLINRLFHIADKTLSVGENYLDGWSEDAALSAKITSTKKKIELDKELASLNKELSDAGLAPVEVKSPLKTIKRTPTK